MRPNPVSYSRPQDNTPGGGTAPGPFFGPPSVDVWGWSCPLLRWRWGGGASPMFQKVVAGKDLHLMKATGQGDLFLADAGTDAHLLELKDEQLR